MRTVLYELNTQEEEPDMKELLEEVRSIKNEWKAVRTKDGRHQVQFQDE